MSQKGDYRNMLFLVGFCALSIGLTVVTSILDSKLDHSECQSDLLLWCNRIILIISLLLVGITITSIIYNAKGLDIELTIRKTGSFYGNYGIILSILGLIILVLTSIMLAVHSNLNKKSKTPSPSSQNTEKCSGVPEMIALVILSLIFMGTGIGMTFVSFNLIKTKRNKSGVDLMKAKLGTAKSGFKPCKKGIYLDEKEINKNIKKLYGKKINYKAGDCEWEYPCFDKEELVCYNEDGVKDDSWNEKKEIRKGKTKSFNRIEWERRADCNDSGGAWDNDAKDKSLACKTKSDKAKNLKEEINKNGEKEGKYNWQLRWRDKDGKLAVLPSGNSTKLKKRKYKRRRK